MSKWRIGILLGLIAAPATFLVVFGSYQLLLTDWWYWAWSPLAACVVVAVMLWRYWQGQLQPDLLSTEREQQALRLMEARAETAGKIDPQRLLDWQFYVKTAQDVAQEMAQVFHPGAKDYYGSVTVPEILIVIELVASDMTEMVDRYAPGGHLMTVNDWISAGKLSKTVYEMGQRAYTVYAAVSALFNPYAAAVKYLAAKAGYKSPQELLRQKFQQNLLLAFYTAYLERLGEYLIALNSGRLRDGAERFRQQMQGQGTPEPTGGADGDATEVVAPLAAEAGRSMPVSAAEQTIAQTQRAAVPPRARRRPLSKGRILVLALLLAAPVGFLLTYGAHQAWVAGWWSWLWWPMAGCTGLAMILGWYWQKQQKLLRVEFKSELYWTERDQEAMRLVEARTKAAGQIDPDTMLQMDFYLKTAEELALEFAHFYHPTAKDYYGSVTVPEILAVVELVAHDLGAMVDQFLPGGHQMTVNDWKRARTLYDWYRRYSIVSWAVAALFNPIGTALRYLASEVGINRPLALLQQNLLVWFYTAFLQRMGTYLIALNSGRLRVGAERYRQILRGQYQPAPPTGDGDDHTEVVPAPDAAESVAQVTITLLGQVKAGKSSLVNAILGEQRARTHVLPETRQATAYDLDSDNIATHLHILDTVGYGHEGPRQDQMAATQQAAQHSDVLLLVLHARNPARQPDLLMLAALRKWFDSRPELKMPRVLGVLTHVDLLSPAMEWQPPYNWQRPARVKEQQMAQALEAVREQLGEHLVGVVPVCVAEGKVWGIEEGLLPAMVQLMDEARAVAMLRCLRAEVDTRKIRKVFDQFLAAGKQGAKVLWEAMLR
jgi:predicted GTPase/membrane protein implicated in regulation of membrane protease activity